MIKRGWKVSGALAVLVLASTIAGGQADAATITKHHKRDHQNQSLGAEVTNASEQGAKVIKAGEKYLGIPYDYGSSRSDKSTMDCSEFTMWAFREGAGIDLGHGGARSQYKKVSHISRNDLQVGDLVFFSTSATMKYSANSINRIGHVGIYAGNGKVLHTYGKGGVTYTNMASGWWDTHFVAAGRVLK